MLLFTLDCNDDFFSNLFLYEIPSFLPVATSTTVTSIGWKYLAISMISVATAMLCKEQGITVTAICAVYEIFVIQKVSLIFSLFIFFFSNSISTLKEKS